MTMLRILVVLLILAAAGSAAAGPREAPDADRFANDMRAAGELIRQGLEKMLSTVDAALRGMPQYEFPRIDENGDIIIRRKPPAPPDDNHRTI
jgi:hypothetical protein